MFEIRLKELRNELQLNQKEFAKLVNLSPSTIAMYETGRRNPDPDTLKTIAAFFNVSVDYILGVTDNRTPYSNKSATADDIDTDAKRLLETTQDLSPESKKMLEEYVKLLKAKEMIDKSKNETSADKAL